MRKVSPILFLMITILFSCSKESKNTITPVAPPIPKTSFKVNLTVTPINSGTITPASGTFDKGQVIQLSAKPSEGYLFKEWQGGATGSENPISLTVDSDKDITAVFEIKPYIPKIGDFYNGGIITKVYPLTQTDYQYSPLSDKPNFIIEKMALNEFPFESIKNLIDQTYAGKIGEYRCYILNNFSDFSNKYWLNLSDSLVKYGGTKFDISQDYTMGYSLNEKRYRLTLVNYATYLSSYSRDFKTALDPVKGTARLASQEYILNNKNVSSPKIGDYYGRTIRMLSYSSQSPRIFSVDIANKKIKIFQQTDNIGYINFSDLSTYAETTTYNMGYGFRIPTLEELDIINKEFYLKGKLSFGNFITYSANQDPNNPENIQMFNFQTQQIEIENKNINFLRVSSPLLVKEISY